MNRALSILSLVCLSARATPESLTLRSGEVIPELRLRVRAVAQSRVGIQNPAQWSQFQFLVPEGTEVKKGDLLMELDMTKPREDYLFLLRDRDLSLYEGRKRMAELEDTLQKQMAELAGLRDELQVLDARIRFQKSLPRPEEVALARGRHEIATRNLESRMADLARDQERYTQRLISEAALERSQTQFEQSRALLAYAEGERTVASSGASPRSLQILALQRTNVELGIAKLEDEMERQRRIVAIEREGIESELSNRQRRLDEKTEEIAQARVVAPRDGIVLYPPRTKRELASGGKFAKGVVLLELPDRNSLAFEGVLPEHLRARFREGDPATLRLNAFPGRSFTGSVQRIRTLPRDLGDSGSSQWGEAESLTGVKGYDLTIVVPDLPPDVPIGVYGEAVIRSGTPVNAVTVPLTWVRVYEGRFHLARNGRFEKVEGDVVGQTLLLRDEGWDGAVITMYGEEPVPLEQQPAEGTQAGGFVASGELTPFHQVPVKVPPVSTWDLKVQWLIPEDSSVTNGQVLAVLSSERLSRRLDEYASEAEKALSDLRSAEESLAIRRKDSAFQLEKAHNLREIRRLEAEIVETGLDSMALLQAELDVAQAQTELRTAERALHRARKNSAVAPREVERLQREHERRSLRLQNTELTLHTVQQGADPVRRSEATLAWLRQSATVAELEKDLELEMTRTETELRRLRFRELRSRERLRTTREQVPLLTLHAPTDGLLKYGKVWDGLAISKVREGGGVWSGVELMQVSDASRMSVRIPVPEAYFPHLHEGLTVSVRIPSLTTTLLTGTVNRVESALQPADKPGAEPGLYGNHELGFRHEVGVHVLIEPRAGLELKPGAVAHITFPFPP